MAEAPGTAGLPPSSTGNSYSPGTPRKNSESMWGRIREGDKAAALEHCGRIRLLGGLEDRQSLGRAHSAQEETALLEQSRQEHKTTRNSQD